MRQNLGDRFMKKNSFTLLSSVALCLLLATQAYSQDGGVPDAGVPMDGGSSSGSSSGSGRSGGSSSASSEESPGVTLTSDQRRLLRESPCQTKDTLVREQREAETRDRARPWYDPTPLLSSEGEDRAALIEIYTRA